jgi:hypothetical protein
MLLFKAIASLLFIAACMLQPFFLSIAIAVALSLVSRRPSLNIAPTDLPYSTIVQTWVECEPLRCFRQSLAILLALLATYHFGCLVMSWVARYHPFDEASAFTLPALCLAFFCLHLRELPHLHSGLAYVPVLSCTTQLHADGSRSLLQCGCGGGGCLSVPVLLARCP